jgi:hypothetical protein
MSLGVYGFGCEDALTHLLNYVWPNIFETSPHLVQAFMGAIEGLKVSLGPIKLLQYTLQVFVLILQTFNLRLILITFYYLGSLPSCQKSTRCLLEGLQHFIYWRTGHTCFGLSQNFKRFKKYLHSL